VNSRVSPARARRASSNLRRLTPSPVELPPPYTSGLAQATISRFRQLIRSLNYVVSTHAAEELEDANLSILDLENIVLTGKITERQRDV
jgi:hypothetical protein